MAIGNNLSEALENIVSQEATNIDTYTTDDLNGIIQSIIKANKNLSASMESKDLEVMGRDIKSLQELINKLEVEKAKEDELKQKETENTQDLSGDNVSQSNETVKTELDNNNLENE